MNVFSVMRSFLLCSSCLLCVATGCQPTNVKTLGGMPKQPEIPDWDAIGNINKDPNGMQRIYMLMDGNTLDPIKVHVNSADFRARVAKLAADPIPDKWNTPERQEAKKKLVGQLEALCDAAKKKVPDAEFKKLLDPLNDGWAALLKPVSDAPAENKS